MKQWAVKFRVRRLGCCGGKKGYWEVKTQVVTADTAGQAQDQIIHEWSLDNQIEIKQVDSYDQGKQ
jgi:hypothetical protein